MKRFTVSSVRGAVRSWAKGMSDVDPAVALGLFGTGVGLAIPAAVAPSRTAGQRV